MEFRTEIELPEYNFHIDYLDRILLMGSCFSDHIGNKLVQYKFRVLSNPLGITFNPLSIAYQLNYVLDPDSLTIDDLVFRDGLWHHFDFHGQFSQVDPQATLVNIRNSLRITRESLEDTKVLFVTLGTATVYTRKSTGRAVANNHKFPLDEFRKRRLTVSEMIQAYRTILPALWKLNPELKVVFTVSPVRYTRDGLLENQRSKASLLLAIDALQEISRVYYFPSFEIFIDDLRDYRYYAADLVHPGQQGIQYTWIQFREAFFDVDTLNTFEEVRRLVKSAGHRPIHPKSDLHRTFLLKLRDQIRRFQQEHPALDFREELVKLEAQLA